MAEVTLRGGTIKLAWTEAPIPRRGGGGAGLQSKQHCKVF